MKTPESIEKAEIKKYLDLIGAWHCSPQTWGLGKSGAPDIVACIKGIFWGIEVKREGKKPTELQLNRAVAIRNAWGVATWGTAEKVIQQIEKAIK